MGHEGPAWFRSIAYLTIFACCSSLIIWGNVVYNSLLIATPDASDGDPVHMRSPIEWRKMLLVTFGITALVCLVAIPVK